MAWCERSGVEHVFGLARNARLEKMLSPTLEQVKQEQQALGEHSLRRYTELRYQTQKSWSQERRGVGKAERLGEKNNPRFGVTSLDATAFPAEMLYAQIYCARGDMETQEITDPKASIAPHGGPLRQIRHVDALSRLTHAILVNSPG